MDSLLEDAVKKQYIPGAVALIRKDGQVILHKAYGLMNLEKNIVQSTGDIFRLASMTKGLTAVAVLQLCQSGKLNVNDPVSRFLPAFREMNVLDSVYADSSFTSHPANNPITVHHLLTHTSGIGYGFQDERYNAIVLHQGVNEGFCEDKRTSMENTLKIAGLPLLHEPGERYTYGMSYDVLGTLVEAVSGQRFDAYIREHILEPLEMNSTFFTVPLEKRERLVKVYQPHVQGEGLIPTLYTDINYPITQGRQFFSGGADLCGTAEDFSHFITMLMQKGRYKDKVILDEPYVEMMLSRQSQLEEVDSYQGYGTWIVNEKGEQKGPMSRGTYSFGGFFDTYSWGDPALGLEAVLLLQMYPTNRGQIHEKYQEYIYKKLKEEIKQYP